MLPCIQADVLDLSLLRFPSSPHEVVFDNFVVHESSSAVVSELGEAKPVFQPQDGSSHVRRTSEKLRYADWT